MILDYFRIFKTKLEIQFYFVNFVIAKMVSWYKYDFVLGAAVSSKRETMRELKLDKCASRMCHNYELNEQWINALYMDMLERGSDSISATELIQLESLAKSCPAIAGTAVYKAARFMLNTSPH
jgi:hypothetical protein